MGFPLIHLNGNTYEQGLQHGRQLQREIVHNLGVYFGRFTQEARLNRTIVRERAAIYADALRLRAPHYYVGLTGIAEGSGADLLDIVALNVRYEIMYCQYAVNAADGCTSLVIDRDRSADEQRYMAQNWDWFPDVVGALLHTTYPDNFETLAFTEAGIFGGKIGLNSAGVGLLINGLYSFEDDWRTLDVPFHARCYHILRQRNLDDALRVITGSHRACSGNFVVGSAADSVFNVETTPSAYSIMGCADGCLAHTNHFLAGDELEIQVPEADRIGSSHRQLEAEMLLSAKRQFTLDDIQAILSNHDGNPHAVCQHGDPMLPDYEQYTTVTAIILNLDQREMYVAAGNPCTHPFETYRID